MPTCLPVCSCAATSLFLRLRSSGAMWIRLLSSIRPSRKSRAVCLCVLGRAMCEIHAQLLGSVGCGRVARHIIILARARKVARLAAKVSIGRTQNPLRHDSRSRPSPERRPFTSSVLIFIFSTHSPLRLPQNVVARSHTPLGLWGRNPGMLKVLQGEAFKVRFDLLRVRIRR